MSCKIKMASLYYNCITRKIRHKAICQVRFYSLREKKSQKNKYSHTVLIQKTKFPQWLNGRMREELDEHLLKTRGFSELYSWQRENISGQEFVMHDGPPYANGTAHMGHALNKVLKDIINRHKLLQGNRIHYKPGWDCHGLPIELKALAGSNQHNYSSLYIRDRARKFAERAISDQKGAFKSWGVMADWDHGCYYTFDADYVATQLQQFYSLFEQGLIYRDMKPVYWSPASRSALAEAELVYRNDHRSLAWTCRLRITNESLYLNELLNNLKTNVYVLIWTTTPWSLPANRAIAYNPEFSYALVKFAGLDGVYIVASLLVSRLEKTFNQSAEVMFTIPGGKLKELNYKHPLSSEEFPLLPGSHVTTDIGTGFVHTAPAHGHEDFLLALANNIPFTCEVDEEGQYTSGVHKDLQAKHVLSQDTQEILSELFNESIMAKEEYVHSYPYDWRTNTPVIIRASLQWFIKTDALKNKALNALKSVNIMPARLTQALIKQIESRPYWCISRQRSWGVPIPALYTNSEKCVLNRELLDHYCALLKRVGTDFWWSLELKDMIPHQISKNLNVSLSELKKGEDILDIWLDSGLSWAAVLEGKVADLYVEGIDQCTGWFQSSLITSVAITGSAPYKNVYVHGFTLDSQGRKMSKSLGNIIDPQEITKGIDKNHRGLGIDVLRWWVAAHGTQHTNIPVSSTTFDNSDGDLKKIRNTFKFLLCSISDFPLSYIEKIPPAGLSVIDLYILHSLASFLLQVRELYESFQFNKVCQKVTNFVTNEVSALYFSSVKDKLYCSSENSLERRNIQYTMYHILNTLATAVAPVVPVLVEEVYMHHPHNIENVTYFRSKLPKIPITELKKTKEDVDAIIRKAAEIKEKLVKECPLNITSLQIWCTLLVGEEEYFLLKFLQEENISSTSNLVDFLQVSGVTLISNVDNENFKLKLAASDYFKCPRCWKYNCQKEDSLCDRCNNVLNT